VILSFVATTIAYVVNPGLEHNEYYVLAMILLCFWGMTLLNYLGIRTSSIFSTIGVIVGTILPGIFIIALGVSWVMKGNPLETSLALADIIPHPKNINNMVFLAGMFLAFAGLEVTGAHAADVINPQKNYPRSILLAAIITFAIFMLGSLSIAVVIPKAEISLVSGLMEAFKTFFAHYNLTWILPVMGVLLVIGAIAEVNSWIIGPIKGLYATAKHGDLPPIFQKLNKRGIPTNLLLFQGIIVTVASFVFLKMPSLSTSYWVLSALSAQSYLVMYILMFISVLKLRYSKPNVLRPYRIPYKNKGIWLVSIAGILSSLFAIFIGFVPPAQLQIGNHVVYELILGIGLFVMCGIPLIIYQFRKPHWNRVYDHQ
jgi:amino acid transporter